MRYLLVFVLFLLACGCEPHSSNEKQRLVNAARERAAVRLEREKGLVPFGSGGQTSDRVKMLHLAFQYRGKIGIPEARRLVTDAVEELVKTVNADEKLRPYLSNYPFRPDNVEVEIYLKNPDRAPISPEVSPEVSPESLRVVASRDGKIEYEASDPLSHRLVTVFEENYEEALRKR